MGQKNSKPDINAKIINIDTQKVQYAKNGTKYKTTVSFSDGFIFITHKTNREDGFFNYQISIDESLRISIIEKAICLHQKAVEKAKKHKGRFSVLNEPNLDKTLKIR